MLRFCAARHSARYPHLALQFAAVCYDVYAMKKKSPPNQITHVLFDWDGTLINSYAADLNAYVTMFAALEVAFTEAQIADHYSPNWYRLYRAAKLPRKHGPTADARWTKAYGLHKPPLLPGARRVIQALARTHTLGIVTSGNRARVRRQLREFNLRSHFATFVASEDVTHKKPHPAPLRLALERLRAKPEQCVYVGDTAEDMEMAMRVGVRAIGVVGPFPTEKRLRAAGPEIVLANIAELIPYLRRT
jgi:HAD superfamily hydrolase (TIGR01509 family)